MKEIKFSTIQVHPFVKFENEIHYIILQRNINSVIYPGMWQVITGKIEENETAYQAAIRELKEETNLDPLNIYHIPFIGSFYDWRKDNIENIPCFAIEVENQNVILSHEHSDFKILKYEELNKYLSLPSHIIGAEYLKKYIIDYPIPSNFKITKK
jgi:8-oxo-dGTP pyrophosphatase MutT (NUDIX family)